MSSGLQTRTLPHYLNAPDALHAGRDASVCASIQKILKGIESSLKGRTASKESLLDCIDISVKGGPRKQRGVIEGH